MTRDTTFDVEFVEAMPSTLQPATVYVSLRYRMTAHLCMCGCDEKVVNPLRPNRWSLTYDGETVSLAPSVGNSGIPCKSHYWLSENRVRWLPPMTAAQSQSAFRVDGWHENPDLVAREDPRLGLWRRVVLWLSQRRPGPESD